MKIRQYARFLLIGAALGLSGCASTAGPDPLEPVGRAFHGFNKGVDTVVLRPAAKAYDFATPTLVRHVVGNFLAYLDEPSNILNAALQGDMQRTGDSLTRFLVNTTAGGLGLLDPATTIGIPDVNEDFGQTLAVWGVGEGPYMELPLLGPTTLRDSVGRLVDVATRPTTYLGSVVDVPAGAGSAPTILGILEARAKNASAIDQALYNTPDSYAAVRSFYLQNRRKEILNGALIPAPVEDGDDAYDGSDF